VFHRGGRRIRSIRWAWERATKAAGIDGKIPHDLRRSAVRDLERAGVARSVAMALVGHRTQSMYERYAIVAEADQREGARKLAALRAADAKLPARVVPFPTAAASGR
jgi:integrase